MTANDERQMGRAKNGVLSFFERKLSVPRIYIDAEWSNQQVDVLAIDRDGVGDVHVALLFLREYYPDGLLNIVAEADSIKGLFERFGTVPAQFKYVVGVEQASPSVQRRLVLSEKLSDRSFSKDGLGRIGLAQVEVQPDEEPRFQLLVKPERFRAKIALLADEFVEKHTADWEIRA